MMLHTNSLRSCEICPLKFTTDSEAETTYLIKKKNPDLIKLKSI